MSDEGPLSFLWSVVCGDGKRRWMPPTLPAFKITSQHHPWHGKVLTQQELRAALNTLDSKQDKTFYFCEVSFVAGRDGLYEEVVHEEAPVTGEAALDDLLSASRARAIYGSIPKSVARGIYEEVAREGAPVTEEVARGIYEEVVREEGASHGKPSHGKAARFHQGGSAGATQTTDHKPHTPQQDTGQWNTMGAVLTRAKWLLIGVVAQRPIYAALHVCARLLVQGPGGAKLAGSALAFLLGVTVYEASLDGSTPSEPLPPTPLPPTAVLVERQIPMPKAWGTRPRTDVSVHLVPTSEAVRREVEAALRATAHTSCVGRDGSGNTRHATVLRVERIENLGLWKQYWHRKREMVDSNHAHNVTVRQLVPPVGRIGKLSRAPPALQRWPSL